MKVIDLGTCCIDCFNAVNFNAAKLDVESIDGAMRAGKALSVMADMEGVRSLHTGDPKGFSNAPCPTCGSTLAGERYEIFALADREDIYG